MNIAQPTSYVASAAYGTVASSDATFIWSDLGLNSHDADTLDWNNDYLVSGLSTDSQTMTN